MNGTSTSVSPAGRLAGPAAAPAGTTPDRRRWLILGTVSLAQLMVVLDATIVNIALPSAQRALGFTTVDRQWVVTAYALAFGSLLLFGGRLRRRLSRRRRDDQLRHAGRGARLPGRVRRAARARGAVDPVHDVHRPEGARQGVRRLRRDRGRRWRNRPGARRAPDRVPVLALVPVREPDLRWPGGHRCGDCAAPPGPARPVPAGPARRRACLGRNVLPGLRVLQRGLPRLARAVHLRIPGRGRGAARRLRALAVPRGQPAAAAPGRARPQPRRRLPGGADRRGRHIRHLLVPYLLPAADPALLPGDQRRRLPAADRDAGGGRQPVQRGAAAQVRPQATGPRR